VDPGAKLQFHLLAAQQLAQQVAQQQEQQQSLSGGATHSGGTASAGGATSYPLGRSHRPQFDLPQPMRPAVSQSMSAFSNHSNGPSRSAPASAPQSRGAPPAAAHAQQQAQQQALAAALGMPPSSNAMVAAALAVAAAGRELTHSGRSQQTQHTPLPGAMPPSTLAGGRSGGAWACFDSAGAPGMQATAAVAAAAGVRDGVGRPSGQAGARVNGERKRDAAELAATDGEGKRCKLPARSTGSL